NPMAKKSANRPKKYKKKMKFKLKQESVQSLAALFYLALAGLSLLSFIGQSAGTHNTLQNWVGLTVGWAAFMVPVVFLSAGLTLSRIDWSIAKVRVLVGLVIITFGLAAILHPISGLYSAA